MPQLSGHRPSGPGLPCGPQSPGRTKPIDTAPTAAAPIIVKTTRRERFMGPSSVRQGSEAMQLLRHCRRKRASQRRYFHGIVRRNKLQPPPEKCEPKACANDTNPPRATVPELDGEVPVADLFPEESPP